MKELCKHIKNTFFSKNFILFVIIGVFNTFNGTLVSYVLSLCLQPNLAFVVGYIISLCIAYMLNSVFNFKQKMSLQALIKFCISYIPNFIIQNITVIIVYNILGWYKLIAYALAAIIGIPVTYLFLKFFAFTSKEEREMDDKKNTSNENTSKKNGYNMDK